MTSLICPTRWPLIDESVIKAFPLLLLAVLFAACEHKPTEEELEQKRFTEEAQKKATPKPGEWMFKKDRKNPLEGPKK